MRVPSAQPPAKRSRSGAALCGLLALAGVAMAAAEGPSLPVFTDITGESGITFKHSYGDHHLDNIVEGTGGGGCTFDYNGDGLMDVYFVTGTWTKSVSSNEGRDLRGKLSNRLYKNNGNGTFTDVTDKAGVDGKGIYSSGCSAADYDNDGHVDLFVMNYGSNILYHNNGDGTFTDVTEKAGLAVNRWSLSAVWLDYNNDGLLDVYVANYLKYDDGKFRDFYPAQGYPGPLSYEGQPTMLFRNNGDGTFTDLSKEAGVYIPEGRAMSVTALDLNNDGCMDIFVTNDAMESYYFESDCKGRFKEKALELGIAYGEHGQGVSSMGPVFGDVNRDGLLDLYIPNLNYCSLLVQGKRGFKNVTDTAGVAQMMGQYAGWGAAMVDYDNDGWLDIFTVHGNAHHEYVEEATLARNRGDGSFEDVSNQSGPYFHEKYVSRGLTYGDYDNDGDIDFLVLNLNDSPRLLRNDGGNKSNWLVIEPLLKFSAGTRTAVGTRVTVTANGIRMVDDVNPVRGYLSTQDPRLFFGLGKAEKADSVEIRWPDGKTEKFTDVKARQFAKYVHEGKVTAAPAAGNGGR
jgi:enediyne biosynthesis protein E4